MLEIVSQKYQIKINGTVHEMDYPTADSFDELLMKLNQTENKSRELKLMRDFFSVNGLSEDVLKVLQIQHYNLIFEDLMPKKN